MHSMSVTELEALAVKTSHEHYPDTGPEIRADFMAEARARYSAADDGPRDSYLAEADAIFTRMMRRSAAFHRRLAELMERYGDGTDTQTFAEVIEQSPEAEEILSRMIEEFRDVIEANPGMRVARAA